MKTYLKFIAGLVLAAALFTAPRVAAATASASVTGGTPVNLLAGNYILKAVLFVNSSTNLGTLKFYDSGTTSTNYVQGAYVSYATVSTNWSQVFTNSEALVVTNTFTGVSRVGTTVTAVTNEKPAKLAFIVKASDSRSKENLALQSSLGWTLLSTVSGTIEYEYDIAK